MSELRAAAERELRWLVDEHGYAAEAQPSVSSSVRLRYFGERTEIECWIATSRAPELFVDLGLAGEGLPARLNECLEAHGLEPVDLSLPYGPSLEDIEVRLRIASGALRALAPYEVGGNWGLP